MKKCLFGILLAFSTNLLFADDSSEDNVTSSILVKHEWFEMSQEEATHLLYGSGLSLPGKELREKILKLVAEKKAKIHDRFTIVSNSGAEVRKDDTKQVIYPTEWDPAEYTEIGYSPPNPTAFEERPIGIIMDSQATRGEGKNENFISLDLSLTKTAITGKSVFATYSSETGNTEISMHEFSNYDIDTGLTLEFSTPELVSMYSKITEKGKVDSNTKIIHFITAINLNE